MSKKLPLRYEKHFYEEPPKPEADVKRFKVELVDATNDRVNHWPGYGREDSFYEGEYNSPEDTPEYSGKLDERQCLSLQQINALVKEHGLDESKVFLTASFSKVFLTASFSEDYLSVEVVHIKEQNEKETQQEYQEQLAQWNQEQQDNKQEELQRLEMQMDALKLQAERLKK